MSFLISTARNCRQMVDRLALVLGLVLGPLLTARHVELDLMWTGVGRRHARLCRSPLARGRRMNAV